MSNKVQDALKAREEEKKKKEQEAKNNKVTEALKARENAMKSDLSTKTSDWQKRINAEVEAYNKHMSSSAWGLEFYDPARQNDINVGNLIGEISGYRKYLDEGKADELVSMLEQMHSGYGLRYSYASESDYNKARSGWLSDGATTNADTVAQRQAIYKSNQDRIAEIDKEIDSFGLTWIWGDERKRRNELEAEREALVAENNKYNQRQGKMDSYYTPMTDEVRQSGANRNYTNASKDDLWRYGSQYADMTLGHRGYDYDGNIVDAGGRIIYNADDPMVTAMRNNDMDSFWNTVVQDKLGMYLSSTDADFDEAENRLIGGGNMNDQWAIMLQEGVNNAWNELTPDEITLYYHLYNTQGQKAAYDYLDAMTVELTYRATQQRAEDIANAPLLEQIMLNVASIPMNVFGGAVGLMSDAANAIKGEEYNPYSAGHAMSNDASFIRQDTASDIDKATGNFGIPWLDFTLGDAYQSGMSFADSAFGGLVLGGFGEAALGMNAATSTMRDVYERGGSTDQIVKMGILAGAAEAAFEHFSLGELRALKNMDASAVKGLKDWAVRTLVMGGVEASEEMATEIANTISDAIIMGSQSNWTDVGDFVKNVLNAGIGGFISGGFGGGLGAGAKGIQYNYGVSQHGQSLIDDGSVDALQQLARDMMGVSKDVDKLSIKVKTDTNAKNVGRLSVAMQNSIASQNLTEVQNALVEKGLSKREAQKVAEKLLGSEKLSKKQMSNEDIKAVANELVNNPNSAINERNSSLTAARLGVSYKDVKRNSSMNKSVQTEVDIKERVSEDGKTTQVSTGEAITIDKSNPIAKTKDGKVYFNTNKGVVESSDVTYANEAEGLIYESFVDLNPGFANALIKNYDGKMPVQSYIKGMREGVVLYGKHNFQGVGKDISNATYFAELSEADQAFALKLGRNLAEHEAKVNDAPLRQAIRNAAKKAETEGKTTDSTKPKEVTFRYDENLKRAMAEKKVKLNPSQKRVVNLVNHLSKALGMNVVIYDATMVENEELRKSNGGYVPETNTLYLDLQNATTDRKTIAYSLSHELVHWLKAKSATDFNNFAKFLMEQYATHGVDTATLLKNKMAKYESNADEAFEEMIADACETLLLDSNAVPKLMELRKADLNLFEKIMLHIRELINKIRAEYKKYSPTSDEAKALLGMTDVLDQIYAKFEEAMVGATEASRSLEGVSMDFTANDAMSGTDLSDITQKPTMKLQEKTEYESFPKETIKLTASKADRKPMDIKINGKRFKGNASVRELRNARFEENGFDSKVVTKVNNFLDKMRDYLVGAREKYVYVGLQDIYDAKIIISPTTGNIVLSGLVNNGDYEINFDFTKTCKKKIALQEVIEQLAREKGVKNEDGTQTEINLSEENIRHINEVLAANGIETACLCCFVESKRYAIQSHFQEKVCDVWNRLVDEVNSEDGITKEAPYFNFADQNVNDSKIPEGEYDRLYADLERWRGYKFEDDEEGEGAVERKMKAFLINTPNARKKLRLADFVTESGRTNLHKLYPDIESLAKAKIGTALPKAIEAFAPYNGEIELLEVTDPEGIEKYVMKIAGARSQSFSDFLMSHVYDVLQKTASLMARKLTAHTYTKEISRARLFGMTGEKTNMSVLHEIDPNVDSWNAGLHEDGTYFVSDYEAFKNKKCGQIQSIPDTESIALQNTEGYSRDCGRIGVGFSYTHMLKMHNDPDIRQTIGYHSSSLPLVLKPLTNLDKATDYTPVQNTLNFNGFRKPNFDIPDGIPSYATPPQDIEPRFKVTKKGAQSTQRMSKYSKSVATFDIKGKYAELCETMDSTKAAKETLRQLLQFASDNGLALKTSKYDTGRADFDLYVDTEKTQNPYLSADHYIEYCISNGLIPMFYEFALNDNYYKDIYDFNPFDRLSYNPETGLHEDSADRKAYAPQRSVTMVNEDGSMAFPDDFWELVDKYMKDYNYQREDFAKKFPKIMKEVKAIKDAEGKPMVSKGDLGLKKQIKEPLSDKQQANFDYNQANNEIGTTLKTLAGTPIRRYRGIVGKEVGGQVYFHKDYVSDVIPQSEYKKALSILQEEEPNFDFNTIMYDKKKGTIRFDETPDFDTAREPIAGNFVTVHIETGTVTSGYSDYIWHHKWMWVKNDYKGFDVAESWNWSKQWLSVIRATDDKVSNRGIANGTGHGTKNWDDQLAYFGLPLDPSNNSRLKLQKKVEPVKPTSVKWQVGHSESWFYENGYPLYRNVPEEQRTANEKAEMEKRKGGHGTQNKSTLPTYEKIFTYIKNNFDDWENVRILDASSGLGFGTKTGKEMGLDVHDIEPFPNASYNPEWRDYGKLQDMVEKGEVEPFDIIISNAVLNVLAQDARDGLVAAMSSLLRDGGQMFINVIGKDYAGAKNATAEIQYNNKGIPVGTVLTQEGENGAGREVFVWGSNSIQKVFGKEELSAYLSDALGNGYKIETPAKAWNGSGLSGTMLVLTKNGIKKQLKDSSKYAPTFYSHMGKVIDGIKMDKIGSASLIPFLKGKGVKHDEIKWSGIEAFLEGKKSVTKAELQEFVAGSQLEIVEQISDDEEYTRWGDYKLNGGENYRELVFQMPNSTYSNYDMRTHWGDEGEGILAHARIQDMTTADGKKMLFIEEIQSDWHNEGERAGYRTKEFDEALANTDKLEEDYKNKKIAFNSYARSSEYRTDPEEVRKKKYDWLREKMNAAEKKLREAEEYEKSLREKGAGFTPEAPFRTTYHEYVLKRLLRMAAEEGYDSIGWTPADIQMDRWNPNRNTNSSMGVINTKNPDAIAFEEGYRIEYDQNIPKFLRKYGKKWGATVGKTAIPSYKPSETYYDANKQQEYTDINEWQNDVEREIKAQGASLDTLWYEAKDTYWVAYDEVSGVEYARAEIRKQSGLVWSMDITESMEQSVLYEGQMKFQKKRSVTPLSSSDYTKLEKHFGTTTNYEVAGYLLKNGKMLDFSGKHWGDDYSTSRQVDHRDVWDVWENKEKDGVDEMVNMIGNGNIRLMPEVGGINLAAAPSEEQIKTLVGYIRHFRGEVIVDVDEAGGDTIHSFTYNRGTAPMTVIREVMEYFEDGVIPQPQPEYRQFLYQKKEVSNRTILANALESTIDTSTQEGQNELKKLREYQKVISDLEKEEAHLAEVKQQIHDISFTKNSDRSKLNALNDDKVKTQNRIHNYDKKLVEYEAMKPIKDVLAREKELVRKKTEAKAKEYFDAYREHITQVHKEDIGKERTKRREAVSKVRETRDKQEAKKKLYKLVLETIDWIEHPKKTDVKCPDMLKAPFHNFLKSINFDSERALKGGSLTKNDLRIDSAMNSLANTLEKLRESQAAEEGDANGFLDLPGDFVRVLRNMADDITDRMNALGSLNYVVNGGLNSNDIKVLTKLIRTLTRSIKMMNTLYANLRFANAQMLGVDAIGFLDSMGEAEKINSVKDFVIWDNALPYYAFKRFGKAGESIFEELMDAQDKMAYNAKKILDFKEKTWTDKEASEWGSDTHTIYLPSGGTVNLTTANAMGIYCLSRRDNGHGMNHLVGGGIRVVGLSKGATKAKDSRATLTFMDVEEIIDSLTPRQKQVAEAIQECMSTVGSAWGNEISMKRFLTNDFTEKVYYPIESDNENLNTELPEASQGDLYRLLNISATKALTEGANNRVIIRDIFDVFTNHMSDMARLNAYGMALLDYMKWLNYREKTVNDDGRIHTRGVRQSMNNTYGDKAMRYVLNLIKDINGRHTDNGDNPFLMKMMRLGKTAAVGNNLRVAFLQFTSYPRAAMVLSNKSLAMGLTKVPNIKKAEQYCGIALWKSFGFYDTNIARSIEDQIKGATNIRQKIIELSMTMPGLADAITWGALWNACEYEVAKTTKNKVGSEEFYQEVGKKLREVVYATQVVDSTLTRSQIMRSKSGFTQMATAYMSEPTLTANILMDAGFQFEKEKRISGSPKTAWKKTSKIIIGAVGNYCVLQLLTSLAESLADAWRDDDDEEFGEKFKAAFIENSITNIIPFTKIPIISDIAETALSIFGIGYASSDNMATSWLTQIADAINVWAEVLGKEESSKTVYNAIYKTTKALSSVTGVSVSGAMREVVSLWNNTAGAYDSTLKLRLYESTNAELGNELYEAILEGDERQANSLREQFEDEDEVNSALRKVIGNKYKEGTLSRSEAIDMLVEHGDLDDDEAYWKLKEWDYFVANGTTDDYSKYTEFYEAVKTGRNLKAVIKEHLDHGAEAKDLASQITKYYKPLYKEMSNSERASLKGYLLNAYSLLGYNRIEKSKDIDNWLKD